MRSFVDHRRGIILLSADHSPAIGGLRGALASGAFQSGRPMKAGGFDRGGLRVGLTRGIS